MRNQHIKEIDYVKLGTAYRKTFELWRMGKDLKSEMANNTYYRNRRKFLELGIDISKPPIMAEDRTAIVHPIKVLAPMEVVEIPPCLQPYLLRVA